MVMSVDGKITKWGNPDVSEWTSEKDKKHFFELRQQHNLIIMGKNTYLVAKPTMKLSSERLRVVMTTNPHEFKDQVRPGKLTFTNEQPKELIERLEFQGYKKALLVGGSQINAAFLKEKLVNELLLTVEPKLFASGNTIISDNKLEINCKLEEIQKLNDRGTLLLRYTIKYD